MKKSTFLFNLLATTAMATCANAEVTSGDGWSFDSETGVLEITGDGFQSIANPDTSEWEYDATVNDWRHGVTSVKYGPDVTKAVAINQGLYDQIRSVEFDKNSTIDLSDASFGMSSLAFVSLPNNALVPYGAFFSSAYIDVGTGVNPQSDYSFYYSNTYCSDLSCKASLGWGEDDSDPNIYEVDSDGVYTFSSMYFASAGDMLKWITGSDSSLICETHEECAEKAAANRLSSSGGSGGSSGSSNDAQNGPKRIYTLEQAQAAVDAAGTDTVKVRIRYK